MTETKPSNPYSELSFWRFGLLAAVIMAFLPWSLLVHGMLRGFGDTRLLIAALIKDYIQTVIATRFAWNDVVDVHYTFIDATVRTHMTISFEDSLPLCFVLATI